MPVANNLLQKLQGFKDSRGPVGILSRGKNVYKGGSTAAQSGGGPQYGRPQQQPGAVQTIPSAQAAQDPRQNVLAAKEALMQRFAEQNKQKQLGQQQDVTSAIQANRQQQMQGDQMQQRVGNKEAENLRKQKIMSALQRR